MTDEERIKMLELFETILNINHLAYTRMIENLKNEDEYCPRKETAIKAAAWEMINEEIKNFFARGKEKNNG